MRSDQAPADAGFGGLLRRYRLLAGLSQEELAERSGLSVRAIANMERGRTARPHRRSLWRLADALDLPDSGREQLTRASRLMAGLEAAPEPAPGPAVSSEAAGRPAAVRQGPPALRSSLPPDTAAFTGRGAELSRITAACADTGCSDAAAGGVVAIRAIDGMPGVGKTALAVHVAHLLAARFPDRQLFVDLHGHTPGRSPADPADVLADLLGAAGIDQQYLPASVEGRAALWRDTMTGQRALLVLDNAASSAQVSPLLPASAGCLVLVTSRRHLADLPAVVVPVLLETLPPDQAQEMFARLAPGASTDPAAVAELAAMAGNLPLAISLLARVSARHPAWSLADLAGETRATLLTLTAEHASIAAAFEVSCQHLEPAWREFFDCLGLHPGTSLDPYSAASLAGVPVARAARLLDQLHAEGLLTETGHRRYGMHDLIRRYASDRVADTMTAGAREAAMARLFDYYQQTTARANDVLARRAGRVPGRAAAVPLRAGPPFADAGQALTWVRAERPALLACLDQVTTARQRRRIVALTAGIAELLRRDGPCDEALTRHAVALQAARDLGDRPGQAQALLDLGRMRQLTGDYPVAAQLLAEAIAVSGHLGDRAGQAAAQESLGLLRLQISDYAAATEILACALTTCTDLGDRPGQATVLLQLAQARLLTDDYQGADDDLGRALTIFTDLGDRLGEANALLRIHAARIGGGDFSGAAEALAGALAIFTAEGDQHGQAGAHLALGNLRLDTGDYPAATANLDSALAIYRAVGNRLGQANTLFVLGGVRLQTGDLIGAEEILTQAQGIFRDVGQRLGEAHALHRLGEVELRAGDYPAAAAKLAAALAIYATIGSRLGQGIVLIRRGRLGRLTGDYQGAADDLGKALDICHDLGYRSEQTEALNEAGALRLVRGDPDRAAASFQQALELARRIAMPLQEGRALAGLGRCARAAGDVAAASANLGRARAILQRISAADAVEVAAELADLTKPSPQHRAV